VGIPLQAPLPQFYDLTNDYVIEFAAIDATTGDEVAGVLISNIAIQVDQVEGTPSALAVGPFMLVPGPGA
jgi:hypothetical protein